MQSVEHLMWQARTKEEARNAAQKNLKARLRFEEYQSDFSFSEDEMSRLSFLDVGAGDGAFVSYLRENRGNTHAFALDIETPTQDASFFVSGDATNIPYEPRVFDRTVSRNTLHALMFQSTNLVSQAINELIRITKNGGKVLYSFHAPDILYKKMAVLDNVVTQEQKDLLTQKLREGLAEEAETLEYLETLGHSISQKFRNNRKIVTVTIRAVQ